MILINLLPHREAARKRRRETFYATLGLAAVLGVVLAGATYLWYQAQISSQQAKNGLLQSSIAKLETEIKEISTTGYALPNTVPRQFAIQQIVGEEISNMLSTGKSIPLKNAGFGSSSRWIRSGCANTTADHCAWVTGAAPIKNGASVTRCCGPSLGCRSGSSAGEPIVKLPAGI